MDNNVLWLNKLVPKHVLLDDSEIEKRLKPLQIEKRQLPKILLKDPALLVLLSAYQRALAVFRVISEPFSIFMFCPPCF